MNDEQSPQHMQNNTNMPQFDDDLEVSNNSLTILITGILVVVAGFVTYNFFANRAKETEETADVAIEQLQETLDEEAEQPTETEETAPAEEEQASPADLTEPVAEVAPVEEPAVGGVSGSNTEQDEAMLKDTGGPEAGVETMGMWTATDLEPNTQKDATQYTVKEGDTLWEIAEAKYGSGYEWTKLVAANVDTVQMLPNGVQALIAPGQTLQLPN